MKLDTLFALVPWQARLVFWGVVLVLLVLLGLHVNSLLEEHYTAQQNVMVAEDAARANASAAKLAQAQVARDQALLAARGKRLAAAETKNREQDDEMQRLKAAKPENRAWAEEVVPPDIAARHRGVR